MYTQKMQMHFENNSLPRYPYKEFQKQSRNCTENLSHCSLEELRTIAKKEYNTKVLGYLEKEASGRLVDMPSWNIFLVAEKRSLLFCTPGGIVVDL